MIDWKLALSTATALAGSGPDIESHAADRVVEDLRACAVAARGPVAELTGLTAVDTPALVVDRRTWTQANLETFELLSQPIYDKLTAGANTPGPMASAVGAKVGGAQVGAALAFLSSRILGQYDPFSGDHGRLLLVAPNVAKVGTDLGVDGHDFRLWVCLHEETHRAQFTGVPWMREHLLSLVAEVVEHVDVDRNAVATLVENAGEIAKVLRGTSDLTLAEIMQGEDAAVVLDRVAGLMSLLEGHADVVMDEVGPQVVPTVAQIRARFEGRRGSGSPAIKILQRLTGMDAKLRQYRDGAAFVRAVQAAVGPEGFSAVWSEPGHLPDRAEILDPPLWLRRVHG